MSAPLNPKFQKRRPLDDVPGLKIDAVLQGRHAVIKIQALGHTMVFDDLTRENDIDRDSEKWSVEFDGQVIAKMYLHPDHGWPKIVTPFGRDKIQQIRSWVWDIARAHKVNAENILEIRDSQFPASAVERLEHINYQDENQPAAHYFRFALRHVWEL